MSLPQKSPGYQETRLRKASAINFYSSLNTQAHTSSHIPTHLQAHMHTSRHSQVHRLKDTKASVSHHELVLAACTAVHPCRGPKVTQEGNRGSHQATLLRTHRSLIDSLATVASCHVLVWKTQPQTLKSMRTISKVEQDMGIEQHRKPLRKTAFCPL